MTLRDSCVTFRIYIDTVEATGSTPASPTYVYVGLPPGRRIPAAGPRRPDRSRAASPAPAPYSIIRRTPGHHSSVVMPEESAGDQGTRVDGVRLLTLAADSGGRRARPGPGRRAGGRPDESGRPDNPGEPGSPGRLLSYSCGKDDGATRRPPAPRLALPSSTRGAWEIVMADRAGPCPCIR